LEKIADAIKQNKKYQVDATVIGFDWLRGEPTTPMDAAGITKIQAHTESQNV